MGIKIYVASSWRNEKQPHVVESLKLAGYQVYDFRHPAEENEGFHWSDIEFNWKNWDANQFIGALNHPVAISGFVLDWNAMCESDACVMVLPCGHSAHLAAGFFVGSHKPLYILLSDGEPELMYRMATGVCTDIGQIIKMIKSRYPNFQTIQLRIQ